MVILSKFLTSYVLYIIVILFKWCREIIFSMVKINNFVIEIQHWNIEFAIKVARSVCMMISPMNKMCWSRVVDNFTKATTFTVITNSIIYRSNNNYIFIPKWSFCFINVHGYRKHTVIKNHGRYNQVWYKFGTTLVSFTLFYLQDFIFILDETNLQKSCF